MKYEVRSCRVLKKNQLTADTWDFTVEAGELAAAAAPGQFVHIAVPGKALRRPISICGIDSQKGTLRLVFQERGEGTALLAAVPQDGVFDLLGPLGCGFLLGDTTRRAVFVGGGIGTPPLLGAAEYYGANKTAVLGFRNADAVILQKDFEQCGCAVRIATDDGSLGYHGLVTGCLKDLEFDVLYACGPAPMLKAVSALAKERGAQCQVSLEERMACGVGACLGCAVKLCGEAGEHYGHVCKDGPVFPAESVVWEG